MIKILILVLLIVVISPFINHKSSFINPQTVYTPMWSDVYDFLDRQSLKQNIKLDDEAKPYSRKYIASLLSSLDYEKERLNSVERKELEFHKQEYAYELNELDNERWYLFSYGDSLFSLKLSPIAGYGISATGKSSGHQRWIGASTFGTYSNWFGASFDLRDNGEFGDNRDEEKQFSPETGAWIKQTEGGFEYTDVKGSMTFDWGWGNAGIAKDYFTWGHGRFGQLIISQKPPSYPQIRLNLKPVDWLRFYYFHGWLSSQVIDSSSIYIEYPGTISAREKEAYINKYVAANMLTVSPWSWLDASFGNSFVYSGDLRPEMFIPFMFFKFTDHNSGRGGVDDGNGTFYVDVSVKYPETFHFYTTLFVDVTEIRNLLEENFNNSWIGYTIGGKKVDLFIPNLDLQVEYTRINPWVYEHKYETTTYKHIDFVLGHWIGQNSDQFRVETIYRLLRGLKFKLFFESYRKGGQEEIYYAYRGVNEIDLPFLYSPLREEKSFGLNIRFEYLHDLILEGSYWYSDIKDEAADRTPEYLSGKKNSFELRLYYGL
jgi:hypothetical protein